MKEETKIKIASRLAFITFLLVVVFCLAPSAESQERVFGIDYIGGARYEETVVKHHPNGLAAGFLWNVDGFGSAKSVIRGLAATGKAPVIRVHMVWKDNHFFGDVEKKLSIKRCENFAKVVEDFPNIRWMASPFLEPRNPNKKVYKKAIKKCRKKLPEGVEMVSSSLEGTKYKFKNFKVITEMHHEYWKDVKGKTIFSFDGQEAVDSDVQAWKDRTLGTEVFFIWGWNANCKASFKDTRPRAQRTNCLTKKDIKSWIPLADNKGSTCTKYFNLPGGGLGCRHGVNLYKSHAENYIQPIPRSDKPVLIFEQKAPYIDLRAKGQSIYKFRYDKPYSHGPGYVYRGDLWGYEIAELVLKVKKNPRASLYINGDKVGKINPSFRDGFYLH